MDEPADSGDGSGGRGSTRPASSTMAPRFDSAPRDGRGPPGQMNIARSALEAGVVGGGVGGRRLRLGTLIPRLIDA